MLVKFNCGCIGLPPAKEGEFSFIVEYCVSYDDNNNFVFSSLNIPNDFESNTPLTEAEETEVWGKIKRLLADGDRFRQIKHLLSQGGE